MIAAARSFAARLGRLKLTSVLGGLTLQAAWQTLARLLSRRTSVQDVCDCRACVQVCKHMQAPYGQSMLCEIVALKVDLDVGMWTQSNQTTVCPPPSIQVCWSGLTACGWPQWVKFTPGEGFQDLGGVVNRD